MGLESEARWDFSLEFKRGEIDRLGFHDQERLKIGLLQINKRFSGKFNHNHKNWLFISYMKNINIK